MPCQDCTHGCGGCSENLLIPAKSVMTHVLKERLAQLEKWGHQKHKNGTNPAIYSPLANHYKEKHSAESETLSGPTWATILLEEIYEALETTDKKSLKEELVQSAAVIVAWIEDIDNG